MTACTHTPCSRFTRVPAWGLGLACLAISWSAQAGRPLDVDDAGTNETGHGHVELWHTRGADGEHSTTVAPAFAPLPGLELGFARQTTASSGAVAQTASVKWLITPSQEQGCNQGLAGGFTQRDQDNPGARFAWFINTSNVNGGALHLNLGFTQDHGDRQLPLMGWAYELTGGALTPHVQWVTQKGTTPLFGAGLRTALSERVQLDGSVSRQGGQSIWTLGTKFSF